MFAMKPYFYWFILEGNSIYQASFNLHPIFRKLDDKVGCQKVYIYIYTHTQQYCSLYITTNTLLRSLVQPQLFIRGADN